MGFLKEVPIPLEVEILFDDGDDELGSFISFISGEAIEPSDFLLFLEDELPSSSKSATTAS